MERLVTRFRGGLYGKHLALNIEHLTVHYINRDRLLKIELV